MNNQESLSQTIKAIKELVKDGLLEDSGKRENGRIVWQITELGKTVAENLKRTGWSDGSYRNDDGDDE